MSVESAELSRALSHLLRHEPWLYELELDAEGWVAVDEVLEALRTARSEWRDLSKTDVVRMIASSTKRRHEIRGERIRALYGHSMPGKFRREEATPPTVLFHGTSADTANIILSDGLKPMSRQYVHLSADRATAEEVGRRRSRTPTIIQVDAAEAHHAGVRFYRGNDKVWLADQIPPKFVSVAPCNDAGSPSNPAPGRVACAPNSNRVRHSTRG